MYILFLIIFIILVILLVLFVAVTPRASRIKECPRYFTHRGLWDVTAPENSKSAMRKAIKVGIAIELDVQAAADGTLVVFHDEDLTRMCGVGGKVRDYAYGQLEEFTLVGSDETVPRFTDILDIVNGAVPLLIEIKSEGDWRRTTDAVLKTLDEYNGPFWIESFSPLVMMQVRTLRPGIIRGQLATDYFKDGDDKPWIIKFLLTYMFGNILSQPDFVAYNIEYTDNIVFRLIRQFTKTAVWTIRKPGVSGYDAQIFEGFMPEPGEAQNTQHAGFPAGNSKGE